MWVAMLSPSSFRADALGALSEFLEDIEENPALRAAATLSAMDRLRDALLLIEETASVETPGSLLLQDVALWHGSCCRGCAEDCSDKAESNKRE